MKWRLHKNKGEKIKGALLNFLFCCVIFSITLNAEQPVSRIEALIMIEKSVGFDKKAFEINMECPFNDVSDEVKPYVGDAYERGITKGISKTEFAPDRDVTREEFLTMVLRLLEFDISPSGAHLYEQAELSGIYPNKYNGVFTTEEAEDILKRALFARKHTANTSGGIRLIDAIGKEMREKYRSIKEEDVFSPYQSVLSQITSNFGLIYYDKELPHCRILFAYANYSAMHGSRGFGYVVFKDDGKLLELPMFYKDNWNMTMPDEIVISEDNESFYYSFYSEIDIINPWNNIDVLQKAGDYQRRVDFKTREYTEIRKE